VCGQVPCEDDAKVIGFIEGHMEDPGPYVCVGRNCSWFVDAALAAGRIPDCCAPKEK
jgi:hypothetical protein